MLKLRVLKGLSGQTTFDLRDGDNVIGRSSSCQIILAVNGVSKQHAKITVSGGQAVITDLNSSNGTFVNGTRVSHRILRKGDKIGFSNVIMELASGEAVLTTSSSLPAPSAGYNSTATAIQMEPTTTHHSSAPSSQVTPKKSLSALAQQWVDSTVLPGVYSLGERFTVTQVLAGFMLVFVFAVTALSTIPMVQLTKESIEKESQRRALNLAKQLADQAKPGLNPGGVESAIRVDGVENEEGVSMALVIGADGHLIAPLGRGETFANSEFAARVRKSSSPISQLLNDSTIGASVPIQIFNPEMGSVNTTAFAIVIYNMGSMAMDSGRAFGLFGRILIVALLVGAVVFFFMYRLMIYPLTQVSLQLDQALRGELPTVKNPLQFPEFEGLINNMNAALGRMGSGSGPQTPLVTVDRIQEGTSFVNLISEAAFLLDPQLRFAHVNQKFEELTNSRLNSLQLHPTSVLQDTALQLSIDDLVGRAQNQPNYIHENQLPIMGKIYSVELTAVPSSQGGVEYFLGIIRVKGGES